MKRYIVTAFLAGAFSVSAFAQGMALPPGIAAETKQVYNAVKTNLLAAADAMPEANYSFSPVPEEMTFGKWVAHVADAQTGICSTLNGATRRGDAATKKSKSGPGGRAEGIVRRMRQGLHCADRRQRDRTCGLRARTEFPRRPTRLQQLSRPGVLWQHIWPVHADQKASFRPRQRPARVPVAEAEQDEARRGPDVSVFSY